MYQGTQQVPPPASLSCRYLSSAFIHCIGSSLLAGGWPCQREASRIHEGPPPALFIHRDRPNLRLARLDRGGGETGGCAQTSARTWAGARIKVPVAVGARIVGLGVAASRGTLARALFLEVEDSRLERVTSTALELLRIILLDIWKAIASVTGITRSTCRRGPAELTIIRLYVSILLPQLSVLPWRSNSNRSASSVHRAGRCLPLGVVDGPATG